MHERKRQERRDQQHGNKRRTQPRHRRQQDQVERRGVPQRWKPAEIIVVGFHLAVGEIERRCNHDSEPRRNGENVRQHAGMADGIGRHEHISEEIHPQIEYIARPARQQRHDPKLARHRPVDTVHHERKPEPQEHGGPVALDGRLHRQKRDGGARRGENMDGECAPLTRFRHEPRIPRLT